jgi:hypothetical protein
MSFGDILEAVISENWCRAWVLARALAVVVLVLVFPHVFQQLINWYAHWKAAGMMEQIQHAFGSTGGMSP